MASKQSGGSTILNSSTAALYLKSTDKLILLICVVISSLSCLLMVSLYVNSLAPARVIYVQIIASVLGIAAAIVVSLMDYHIVAKLWPVYTVFAVLLVLALKIPELSFMPEGSDDVAWLKLGSFSLQPSEILKFAFIFTFAFHLSKVRHKINHLKTFSLLCLHGAMPTILIADTGDYGSALVFVAIFIVMMFVAGLSWRLILVGMTAALAVTPLIWMLLPNYLRRRFEVAWYPELDAAGIGYQQYQGKLALSSGKVLGRGLFGVSDIINVPECHNDFIFSYIGQTLGFIGCTATVLLLMVLLSKVLVTARHSSDNLGFFICVGAFAVILFQSTINIGMVICVIPVVGVTLPFVSYGGTSVVISYCLIGIVMSVHRSSYVKKIPPKPLV